MYTSTLFSGSIVFDTQPQAVTSMLVHAHAYYLPGSACICIITYNTQSIGCVSYLHPHVLAT